MNLENKTMVVTGAASGIGLALCKSLAKRGALLVMLDLDEQKLEAAAKNIADLGRRRVYSHKADVTDYHGFKAVVDKILDELGDIDVFINNAGIGVSGEFVCNTPEQIDAITKVNYLGMVYGSRIIIEHFYKKGRGHLVNVASAAGLFGCPRMSLYSGTKAGVLNFSDALRHEAARHGVQVSVALPSTTDTPMIMDRLGGPDEEIPGILMAIPLCETEQVAEAIARGIEKEKPLIFPTLMDRLALFSRNKTPEILAPLVRLVGFRPFRWKRARLMKKYGLGAPDWK